MCLNGEASQCAGLSPAKQGGSRSVVSGAVQPPPHNAEERGLLNKSLHIKSSYSNLLLLSASFYSQCKFILGHLH